MKKGQSYITVTDADKNHVLVKALHERGITKLELIYATHLSSCSGWDLINSSHGPVWLGYTKVEALKKISQLTNSDLQGELSINKLNPTTNHRHRG